MKKRLFILILGIIMFIPMVQAKNITKEELVNNIQKYVDEFNSSDRKYESSYPEISGTMEEMMLTINNESINLKNDNVETTIVLNENEQTINVVATDTGATSINEIRFLTRISIIAQIYEPVANNPAMGEISLGMYAPAQIIPY